MLNYNYQKNYKKFIIYIYNITIIPWHYLDSIYKNCIHDKSIIHMSEKHIKELFCIINMLFNEIMDVPNE